MKRDYKLYLNDIRESMHNIESYLNNVSEEDFMKDRQLQDAVIRRLHIIGEATKNIPRALKEKNKHVPWLKMALLRDLISHHYYEVGLKKIWKAAKEDVSLVKESLKKIALV